MKVLAMYLPQYHEIKENSEWWGEGYTEWSAVKSAKPYAKQQHQPRVPLNQNYYDLADESAAAWKWQAELAKKFNVYGFAIYHYWFKTGSQLLEKPMEILLRHPEIDIQYCICWANESWRRVWYGTQDQLLMKQEYGKETDWICHFQYLLPFFKDTRYIKIDEKPLINIYHSCEIADLKEMLAVWKKLAIENGFQGIYVVSGNTGAGIDFRKELFDAYYNFEPSYSLMHKRNKIERLQYMAGVFAKSSWNKLFKKKILERRIDGRKFIREMRRKDPLENVKIFPGVFPQWDNSPRRKYKGTFFTNMDKEQFREQINMVKENYKNADFLYVNAWNEWGEGAYLEPDEENRFVYLEVLRDETAVR